MHLEPQVFDVLVYLVRHRDRAVPKSELLEQVWGDQFVSESALTSRVKSARAALGDSGRDQRHIRTVHGFGYQFVSPVVVTGSNGTVDAVPEVGDFAAVTPPRPPGSAARSAARSASRSASAGTPCQRCASTSRRSRSSSSSTTASTC